MQTKAIKTHKVSVGESIEEILDQHLTSLESGDVIAITSKIISLCQGRVVQKSSISKQDLIMQEADSVLYTESNPYDLYLTIKDNILIPSAGIDESNSNGVYILYPQNIQTVAYTVWQYLRAKFSIENLGVIITDSHTTPMRRGVTGITLGWCGFEPLYSYVNKPDIYGNLMRVTQINILDALATTAVFVMGEGSEQTPMAVINNAPKISFVARPPSVQEERNVAISIAEDLYAPLLGTVNKLTK
jgi:putative folate metabolism gamma-glutamate ligase